LDLDKAPFSHARCVTRDDTMSTEHRHDPILSAKLVESRTPKQTTVIAELGVTG
jgi:hypothetical protein